MIIKALVDLAYSYLSADGVHLITDFYRAGDLVEVDSDARDKLVNDAGEAVDYAGTDPVSAPYESDVRNNPNFGNVASGADIVLVNNLLSTSATAGLTANMGRELRELVERASGGAQVASITAGQTSISLPTIPTDAASVVVEVNGIRYRPTADFTVADSTVTWLNGFTLEESDIVYVSYI